MSKKIFVLKRVLVFIILINSYSCNSKNKKNEISDVLEGLIGANVINVDSLESFTIKNSKWEFYDYDIKIYSNLDGNCGQCIDDLYYWNEFILLHEFSNEVNFSFYIKTDNYSKIEKEFELKKYQFPFVKDYKGQFIVANHLPKEKMYHTFLAINNKIVLVGNPIRNEQLKDLYVRTINKELFGKEYVE